MGWKKLIFGEKMPDKDDPKYKERYEKEVEAGRKTCRFLRLDKAAAAIQRFATGNPKCFLTIVFSVVIFCFSYNIWTICRVVNSSDKEQPTATQVQEQMIREAKSVPKDTTVRVKELNRLINDIKQRENESERN